MEPVGRYMLRRSLFHIGLVAWLLVSGIPRAGAKEPPRPFGIEKRVPWTTSKIHGSLEPPTAYRSERAFPKLSFKLPLEMAAVPGMDRLTVIEQAGRILTFHNDPAVQEVDLLIDLAASHKDLTAVYGIAYSPKFVEDRACYIAYVLKPGAPDGTHVSRFRVSKTEPPTIDPASEESIITWLGGGHNGCSLQFGNDGCLYISTGDGGSSFPPDGLNTGQDVSDLLGSILRIDVEHAEAGRAYRIPADNPFVDLEGARGEIWCYGLRNPWRMSVDPATGDLWVADVGWETWEMVYRVQRGANYGWSLTEGSQAVHGERKRGPTEIVPPTYEHSHIEARSITGGFVYHGKRLPDLVGAYVYGDYVTGKVWALQYKPEAPPVVTELVDTTLELACFGVDHAGELYLVDYAGTIHQLAENEGVAANTEFPRTLRETGLFADTAQHLPANGVIPYSINAAPWTDFATAERFVALPEMTTLGVYQTENVQVGYIKGDWEFPAEAVLAKTLSLEMERGNPASRRRIETQILHRDGDTWRGYAYLWNEDQTDAELAPAGGLDRILTVRDPQAPGGQRQQRWHVASRTECILCHTTRAGSIHGFQPAQLNRDHDYGVVTDNQLRTMSHLGLFRDPLPDPVPKMPDPADSTADLEGRVRAYLHINCAHCHRRGGGGSAAFDIRFNYPLEQTNLLHQRPTQGTFGLHGAEIVAAGDPFRSVMYYRLSKLGRGRMPQFGSDLVDETGLKLIREWLEKMPLGGNDPLPDPNGEEAARVQRLTAAATPEMAQPIIEELLGRTSGALRMATAIGEQPFATPETRQAAIRLGFNHPEPTIRDLFERFVPDAERTPRLGTVVKPQELLALAGDLQRGEELFLKAAGVQCRNCHQVRDQGTALGPNLGDIGRRVSQAEILESILEPSKKIDEKFVTFLVETTQGRVYSGLLIEKSATEVRLKDAQNKEIRIPAGDVEFLAPQRISLMPELLLRDLRPQDVADLLAYLSAQRAPPP